MIVTVTLNPSIDISTSCQHVSPDRKLRCRPERRDPGGGGINVCRIIAELGGQASAIWLRGGSSGAALEGLLDQAGVNHHPIDMAGSVRHSLYVAETSSDREYRFVLPGPDVDDGPLQAVGDALADRELDWLVLSGSLPRGASPECYAKLAGRAGDARVVVDTSGEALEQITRAGVFMIKPNRRELSLLTGRDDLDSDKQIAQAARQVARDNPVRYVLVSLGAGGVLLTSEQATWRLHAPTVKVRSTVGAGDSLVAATVLGFSRGEDPPQAARLGVAAGSAAVMTEGTQLCRRADVEQLYDQIEIARLQEPQHHE
jgi:6-phosphofructokinase 2